MIKNELRLSVHSAVPREMFLACMQIQALAVESAAGRDTPVTSSSSLAKAIRCCINSFFSWLLFVPLPPTVGSDGYYILRLSVQPSVCPFVNTCFT